MGYLASGHWHRESGIYLRFSRNHSFFHHEKYYFGETGRAFGESILNGAGKGHEQLIILDEIGPVELKAGGWAAEVEHLVASTTIPQLWVVRRSVLKRVIRQWNIGEILLIDIL